MDDECGPGELPDPPTARDRSKAVAAVVSALAIALAAVPVLGRADHVDPERVEARQGAALLDRVDAHPVDAGGRGGRGDTAAPSTAPTVTIVLPSGLVIPYSVDPPAFFQQLEGADEDPTRPAVFGGSTSIGRSSTTVPLGTGTTSGPRTGGTSSSTTIRVSTTAPRSSTTAPRSSTTAPRSTTTIPRSTTTGPRSTTTTRAPRPPVTTVPGQACATEIPDGYVDEPHIQLVFDGQSLSTYPDAEHSWPTKVLRRRFSARSEKHAYEVVARGGTTYDDRAADARTRVDALVASPTASDVRYSVLFDDGGESDLLGGASAQQLFDRSNAYHRARRTAGYALVIGFTIPPAGLYTPAQDQQRRIYNDTLRKYCWSNGIDILIDVASIPQLQDPGNARYFDPASGSVHYTDPATTLVADAVIHAFP